MEQMYDVLIVGGGPAGISGGVYAARKRLKTLFLTYDFGGQSTASSTVENWIGILSITGPDLGKLLKRHLDNYRGDFLEVVDRVKVAKIEKIDNGFKAITEDGREFTGKTVLLATGSKRRKLSVPGAAEYEGKGIVYCASCDAPLFEGMDVAVIGGGNAGFETASQLLPYAKSITILDQLPNFRAEAITMEKLLKDPKVTGITGVTITGVQGDKFVTGLSYRSAAGEEKILPVKGIFVEIGNVPESTAVQKLAEITPGSAIKIDPRTQRTTFEGIWAAGDCTDSLYHQNNIAAGAGVIALEDIYNYLLKK
jgi:alkyl hydroperoxide reductase subunit F